MVWLRNLSTGLTEAESRSFRIGFSTINPRSIEIGGGFTRVESHKHLVAEQRAKVKSVGGRTCRSGAQAVKVWG
jgi:hypothetical protein